MTAPTLPPSTDLSENRHSVFRLMQGALNDVIDTFAANGVDLPERQYLTVGNSSEVIHDCEQVTVTFEQAYTGLPGNPDGTTPVCSSPSSAVLAIEIVRCIETPKQARGGIPKPVEADAHTKDALIQVTDAYLLLEAGMSSIRKNFLGGVAEVSAGTANGAMQGMVMSLVLAIE